MELGLRDRACIVTGASGGIGSATARALAADGAALLLIGRDTETLAAVADAASQAGSPRAETLAVDINEPDAASAIVDACLHLHGRIDVLVNNAGTTTVRPWDQLTDEEWQVQWSLNVMAPMRLIRAAAPQMARGGGAGSSTFRHRRAKRPSGMNMAYGVTKAANAVAVAFLRGPVRLPGRAGSTRSRRSDRRRCVAGRRRACRAAGRRRRGGRGRSCSNQSPKVCRSA